MSSDIRPLFNSNQELAELDVLQLLEASHAAMNDRSFRVTLLPASGGNPDIGYEIQMEPKGQPRYLLQSDGSSRTN